MKLRCRNLFCNAPDAEIDDVWENLEKYQNSICPTCGYIGVMPNGHVLKTKEIINQILFFNDKTLLRDLFLKVNIEKLPKNMTVQTSCNKEKKA